MMYILSIYLILGVAIVVHKLFAMSHNSLYLAPTLSKLLLCALFYPVTLTLDRLSYINKRRLFCAIVILLADAYCLCIAYFIFGD